MILKVKQGIVIITLLVLIFTFNVYAHKPIDTSGEATKNNPIVIKNHQTSWVAYNLLTEAYDVDYYKLLSVNEGEKISISILIPQIKRLIDFKPIIAVIGPDLGIDYDGLAKNNIKNLITLTNKEGIIVKQYRGEDKAFYEPFTQTKYWEKQKMNIKAPVDGDYYLAVFDIEGNADKYVLSIGKEEKWGVKDLIKMPGIWWNVRMFVEQKWSTYIITVVFVLLIMVGLVFIVKKIRNSKLQ